MAASNAVYTAYNKIAKKKTRIRQIDYRVLFTNKADTVLCLYFTFLFLSSYALSMPRWKQPWSGNFHLINSLGLWQERPCCAPRKKNNCTVLLQISVHVIWTQAHISSFSHVHGVISIMARSPSQCVPTKVLRQPCKTATEKLFFRNTVKPQCLEYVYNESLFATKKTRKGVALVLQICIYYKVFYISKLLLCQIRHQYNEVWL